MQNATGQTQQLLDVLAQVVIIVTPVLVTWFIRTYVKGSTAERDIAAIVRLSNTAIDYAENLDKRGELAVPPDVSKGIQKLNLASSWLESELIRAGVAITNEGGCLTNAPYVAIPRVCLRLKNAFNAWPHSRGCHS